MGFLKGIGAIIPGLGTYLAGKETAESQRQANQTNRDIAREANQMQERMSNDAFQRQMKDLERAGLNPMLAMNLGGASVPSAKTAHVQGIQSPLTGVSEKISQTIMGAASAASTIGLQKTQGALNMQSAKTAAAQEAKNVADTAKSNAEAAAARARLPSHKAKADFDQTFYKFEKKNHARERDIEIDTKYINRFNRGLDAGGKVLDTLNPIKKFIPNSAKELLRKTPKKILYGRSKRIFRYD